MTNGVPKQMHLEVGRWLVTHIVLMANVPMKKMVGVSIDLLVSVSKLFIFSNATNISSSIVYDWNLLCYNIYIFLDWDKITIPKGKF